LGHTVYYKTSIEQWEAFREFIERICTGLKYNFRASETKIVITPHCRSVEPLVIEKKGEGFAKTYRIEPYHSIYLLILHSVCSFGSIEIWED
jgi:hypothetical protein